MIWFPPVLIMIWVGSLQTVGMVRIVLTVLTVLVMVGMGYVAVRGLHEH